MAGDPRPLVAVLGATGATGRAAVQRLAGTGRVRLRLGARTPGPLAVTATAFDAEAVGLDVDDGHALARFCAGAAVVLQCAGPSMLRTPAVLAAALAAGAHLVDPAGDLDPVPTGGRAVVLGAGVVPGLSGLLPRLLPPRARRLDLYAGGADRLTPAAAADVLLSVPPRYGSPRALWRDGQVVEGGLVAQTAVTLPGFSGPMCASPLLTAEARRLAVDTGAKELRSYSVFPSAALPDTLARASASDDPLAHVDDVVAAAEADVAAHGSSITLLASARYADGARRTLLRSTDSLALTGALAALAVSDVLAGLVPAGVGWAAEVLDPTTTAERLSTDPSVDVLEF